MKNLKTVPEFANIDDEGKFWDTHDSTQYVDWSSAEKTILPNLKFSTESISLRLPSPLLARLKELANEKDVPYQSLLKLYLSERIEREINITK
jgi:predicted DNA binding CopG/RHH family protein